MSTELEQARRERRKILSNLHGEHGRDCTACNIDRLNKIIEDLVREDEREKVYRAARVERLAAEEAERGRVVRLLRYYAGNHAPLVDSLVRSVEGGAYIVDGKYHCGCGEEIRFGGPHHCALAPAEEEEKRGTN